MKRQLNSEELLEIIFYYMNRLFEEKDFSVTVELLTEMGKALVNCDRASFWFWDRDKKQYWTLAASDSGKIMVPEGSGIVGASISENETVVINAPYADKRFNPSVDKETGYVTRSILCIPVAGADGEVIGAYQAINKLGADGSAEEFTERDVKRLTMAAAFGGKSLESHMLYGRAYCDQLTGLKNRRGFYEAVNKRLLPSSAKKVTALIMCDIDFFKKVNDTYGHNAGDAVLVHIARVLCESIRLDDEVVRWGGEEFILLLSGANQAAAAERAEQIRKKVACSECIYQGEHIKITMSFGVTEIKDRTCIEENIKRADEKLYEAKQSGRNKVVG